MDDDSVFFRYEYRARSITYFVASLLAIVLGILLIVAAVLILEKEGIDLPAITLLLVAVPGAIGGFVGIWAWMRKWTWCLTVSTKRIRWSTPRKKVSIDTVDILQVSIRTTGEWDRMTVETRDGRHYNFPRLCLGNLEQLCRDLRQRFPNISMTYNQLPL